MLPQLVGVSESKSLFDDFIMKFNELDLRHDTTFLYKLNHLKVDQEAISEMQIDALFVQPNEIILYYEGDAPIINSHLKPGFVYEEEEI